MDIDIQTTTMIIMEMNSQMTYFNQVITILLWVICSFMLLTILTTIYMLLHTRDTNEKMTNLLEYQEMKDEES